MRREESVVGGVARLSVAMVSFALDQASTIWCADAVERRWRGARALKRAAEAVAGSCGPVLRGTYGALEQLGNEWRGRMEIFLDQGAKRR